MIVLVRLVRVLGRTVMVRVLVSILRQASRTAVLVRVVPGLRLLVLMLLPGLIRIMSVLGLLGRVLV